MAARIGLSSTIAILSVESRCPPGDGGPKPGPCPGGSEPLRISAKQLISAASPRPGQAPFKVARFVEKLMQDLFHALPGPLFRACGKNSLCGISRSSGIVSLTMAVCTA
jgi:hypothetical protein